jgi:hypothetical protein
VERDVAVERVPDAGEIEGGTGDLLQSEARPVELPGAVEVGDADADVVVPAVQLAHAPLLRLWTFAY